MCDKKSKLCSDGQSDKSLNQTNCHDECIFGQPQSCRYPSPDCNQKVKFHNNSSTLQFPPSFNLRANQKSTPNRHLHDDTCFQTVPSEQSQNVPTPSTFFEKIETVPIGSTISEKTKTVPIHSTLLKQKKTFTTGKNEMETKVDIHNSNDSEDYIDLK